MACYHPMKGFRTEGGSVLLGYERGSTVGSPLLIPCGRCIGCRLERAQVWATRCRHEASTWSRNEFVTLTYDDEHLPRFSALVPEHLTLFLKRFRKAFQGVEQSPDGRFPIRYFAAGEYGTNSKRPHFHLLLFNAHLDRGEPVSRSTFDCPSLHDLWPYGSNAVGDVTPQSAAYVAQYSLKKVHGTVAASEHYRRVDFSTGEFQVVPGEFVRMSRRPGLGRFWFDRFRGDLERGFMVVDGSPRRLPRYYVTELERDPEFVYDQEIRSEQWLLDQDPNELSESRQAAKEAVCLSRRATFSRERS